MWPRPHPMRSPTMLARAPPHFGTPPPRFCDVPCQGAAPHPRAALAALHRAAHCIARLGFGKGEELNSVRHIKTAGCLWLWSLILVATVYVVLCYALGMAGTMPAVIPLQAYLFLFPMTALGWYYFQQVFSLHVVILGSVLWMVCVDWLTPLVATHFLSLSLVALATVGTGSPQAVPHLYILMLLRDLEVVLLSTFSVPALLRANQGSSFTVDIVVLALNFGVAVTMAALLLFGFSPDCQVVWWASTVAMADEEVGSIAMGIHSHDRATVLSPHRMSLLELQLQNQKKLTHTLISNIFPKDIVDELFRLYRDDFDPELGAKPADLPTDISSTITTPRAQAKALRALTSLHRFAGRTHKYAAILFADLVGFTVHAAHVTPHALVDFLDVLFSLFDEVSQKLKVEKIKTIGDCYMCAAWIEEHNDSAEEAANAAVRLADSMHNIAPQHLLGDATLCLRAGVHGGTVVGGIIGKSKFCYDIWGDTVNLASRMESTGVPNTTQVSEDVYNLLKDRYNFEPRSCVTVKGKGLLDTYLLYPMAPCAAPFPHLPSDGVHSLNCSPLEFRRRRLPEGLQSVCDLLSCSDQGTSRSLPGIPRSPPPKRSTSTQLLRILPASPGPALVGSAKLAGWESVCPM